MRLLPKNWLVTVVAAAVDVATMTTTMAVVVVAAAVDVVATN